MNEKEIKIDRENQEENQKVKFELEILEFTPSEITSSINLLKSNSHQNSKFFKIIKNISYMILYFDKQIINFLELITLFECHCIYFEIKFMVKNNFHPFNTNFKIYFLKRFFKQPLFRFLIITSMVSKLSQIMYYPTTKSNKNVEDIFSKYVSNLSQIFLSKRKREIECYIKEQSISSKFMNYKNENLDKKIACLKIFCDKLISEQNLKKENFKSKVTKYSKLIDLYFYSFKNKNIILNKIFEKCFEKNSWIENVFQSYHKLFCLDYKFNISFSRNDVIKINYSEYFMDLVINVVFIARIQNSLLTTSLDKNYFSKIFIHLQFFKSFINSIFSNTNNDIYKDHNNQIIIKKFIHFFSNEQGLNNLSQMILTLAGQSESLGLNFKYKSDIFYPYNKDQSYQKKVSKFLNLIENYIKTNHLIKTNDINNYTTDTILLFYYISLLVDSISVQNASLSSEIKNIFKKNFQNELKIILERYMKQDNICDMVDYVFRLKVFISKIQNSDNFFNLSNIVDMIFLEVILDQVDVFSEYIVEVMGITAGMNNLMLNSHTHIIVSDDSMRFREYHKMLKLINFVYSLKSKNKISRDTVSSLISNSISNLPYIDMKLKLTYLLSNKPQLKSIIEETILDQIIKQNISIFNSFKNFKNIYLMDGVMTECENYFFPSFFNLLKDLNFIFSDSIFQINSFIKNFKNILKIPNSLKKDFSSENYDIFPSTS